MNQRLSATLLILCAGALPSAGQNLPATTLPPEIKELAYEAPDVKSIQSWSKVGTQEATESHNQEVGGDIFVIDAQNSKPRKLISGGARPAWSPDGSQLAYCTWKGVGYGQIEVVNADGTGRRQITNMKGGACSPSWSPDGTKIVFTALSVGDSEKSMMIAPLDHMGIFVVDKNGGDPVPIAPGFAARWSPGGTMLVILRGPQKKGPAASVWLATADGKQSKVLVVSDRRMGGAAWFPDGKSIAASYMENGKYSIFRIYLDGSQPQGNQPQRIAGDDKASWYEPNVSPDGKHLMALTDCPADDWDTRKWCTSKMIVFQDIGTNKRVILAPGVYYSLIWEKK